jgi:TorA-specific chaperone
MSGHAALFRSVSVDALRGLAGLFIAPASAASVESMRGGHGAREFCELERIFLCAPAVHSMRRALDALPPGRDGAAALEDCHRLLFSGVSGPATVSPYESAFAPGGRAFGEAEARMRRLLATMDMPVAAASGEAADHVGIELAAFAELAASSDPDAAGHRRALATGLRGWLGAFAEACAVRDCTGFYAGAALLAAALVELDAIALSGDIGSSKLGQGNCGQTAAAA